MLLYLLSPKEPKGYDLKIIDEENWIWSVSFRQNAKPITVTGFKKYWHARWFAWVHYKLTK